MNSRTELLAKLLVLPAVSVFVAYYFGHNGYEAFVATSLGILLLMGFQTIRSIQILFEGHHWLITKAVLSAITCCVLILSFVCEMLLITAAGHDPRVMIPHTNWIIAGALAAAYSIRNVRRSKPTQTYSWSMLDILASLYSILILYIASLNFYSNVHVTHNVILVLAGQLQYILLYIILRTGYVQWVVSYGQEKLGSPTNLFSLQTERSGLYIFLAALPFFLPLGIILVFTLV